MAHAHETMSWTTATMATLRESVDVTDGAELMAGRGCLGVMLVFGRACWIEKEPGLSVREGSEARVVPGHHGGAAVSVSSLTLGSDMREARSGSETGLVFLCSASDQNEANHR